MRLVAASAASLGPSAVGTHFFSAMLQNEMEERLRRFLSAVVRGPINECMFVLPTGLIG